MQRDLSYIADTVIAAQAIADYVRASRTTTSSTTHEWLTPSSDSSSFLAKQASRSRWSSGLSTPLCRSENTPERALFVGGAESEVDRIRPSEHSRSPHRHA